MTQQIPADIRWQQRFDNLAAALMVLEEMRAKYHGEPDNNAYPIAIIGAFQFTFELAWKTLKDYLNYAGIDVKLPREVIKAGFNNVIIGEGQLWIDMLENRNLMAHSYDHPQAVQAAEKIANVYLAAILQVYAYFQSRRA